MNGPIHRIICLLSLFAVSTTGNSTPTIILLPYGRMLVVDRNIFAQLQADHTGIDFMELSANMIRAQRLQNGSTPSILDSDTTSKGYSPTSLGLSPPAYEDIFGEKDLPPSYSELSFMLRCFNSPPDTRKPEGDEEDDRNSNALRDLIIEELNSVTVNRLSNSNSNQCNVDVDHDSVQENEQPAVLRNDVNNVRVDANSTQSDDDRIGDDTCTVVKESSL